MIILRSPKGWTGPEQVDGIQVEAPCERIKCRCPGSAKTKIICGCWRSGCARTGPRSCSTPMAYRSSSSGKPTLRRRCGWARHRTPTAGSSAARSICRTSPTSAYPLITRLERAESTRQLGSMLAEIYRRNPDRFRLFCPDETNSGPAGCGVRGVRSCVHGAHRTQTRRSPHDGHVMEVLSEHNCHGWLEGYTLTGRHGMLRQYEAFAMVSASRPCSTASGSRSSGCRGGPGFPVSMCC